MRPGHSWRSKVRGLQPRIGLHWNYRMIRSCTNNSWFTVKSLQYKMCNHSPAWFHRGTEEIQEGNHMSIFKWLEGPQIKQYILSLLAGKGYCFQTEYPIFDLYPPYTFGVSKCGIPKTSQNHDVSHSTLHIWMILGPPWLRKPSFGGFLSHGCTLKSSMSYKDFPFKIQLLGYPYGKKTIWCQQLGPSIFEPALSRLRSDEVLQAACRPQLRPAWLKSLGAPNNTILCRKMIDTLTVYKWWSWVFFPVL